MKDLGRVGTEFCQGRQLSILRWKNVFYEGLMDDNSKFECSFCTLMKGQNVNYCTFIKTLNRLILTVNQKIELQGTQFQDTH